MKKILILLLIFSSCTICQKPKKCSLKTTKVDNVNFTYNSTVWKVLDMTKADSIWIDSVSNLTNNK